MRFTHKNNIARGLVGGDNNIFVMKERQVLSNIWSLKIDVERVLIDPLSLKRFFSSNFTFRYIDDVLSLNNSRFGYFSDHIYPIELEIKDTTDTDRSASYPDLHLEIDSEGWLRTNLNDKIFQFSHFELSIYM
jgi:hypothetical protein